MLNLLKYQSQQLSHGADLDGRQQMDRLDHVTHVLNGVLLTWKKGRDDVPAGKLEETEMTMLAEVSQTQKDRDLVFSHMC